MTAAEELREEGRQEGFKEDQRRLLLKMLHIRFGAVPEAAVARVNAADSAELELWIDRILIAPSLAEVLDGACADPST